jgi:MFS family permease
MRWARFGFYLGVLAALLLGGLLPTDWYWRWPYAAVIVLVVATAERHFRRR